MTDLSIVPPDKPEKPLSQHSKKLVRFAEIHAKGLTSIAESARQAGFKQSTAHKQAYKWLGENRQGSEYPVIYDYYEKLRKKNLREFDVNAQAIASELGRIAFSDVTRFIDLPSSEYDRMRMRALETEAAAWKVEAYPGDLEQYRAELSEYNKAIEDRENGVKHRGRPKVLAKPLPPSPPTPHQEALYADFANMTEEKRTELMVWKGYRPGSIRLKNREEIPAALLPAIAEISETRDGIRLKLHDKIAALDKLARWQKMYAADIDDEEGKGGKVVTEITLVVNGSRSKLLDDNAA